MKSVVCLVLCVSVLMSPAISEALSCGTNAIVHLPYNGATDVPLNTRLVVEALFQTTVNVTLTNQDTGEIVLGEDLRGQFNIVSTDGVLEPDTLYALRYEPNNYGTDYSPAIIQFRTATDEDDEPPVAVIGEARFLEGSDMFSLPNIELEVALNDRLARVEVQASTNQGGLGRAPINRHGREGSILLSAVSCSSGDRFSFIEGDEVFVRVRGVDIAGNVGPWSGVESIETDSCACSVSGSPSPLGWGPVALIVLVGIALGRRRRA